MKHIIKRIAGLLMSLCLVLGLLPTTALAGGPEDSVGLAVGGTKYALNTTASGDGWSYDGNYTLTLDGYNAEQMIIFTPSDIEHRLLKLVINGENAFPGISLNAPYDTSSGTGTERGQLILSGSGTLNMTGTTFLGTDQSEKLVSIESGSSISIINSTGVAIGEHSKITVEAGAVLNITEKAEGGSLYQNRFYINGGTVNSTNSQQVYWTEVSEDRGFSITNGGTVKLVRTEGNGGGALLLKPEMLTGYTATNENGNQGYFCGANSVGNGYIGPSAESGYSDAYFTIIIREENACDHEWGEGVVTREPTCSEPGEKTYTCSICEATKTESIATIDHTPVTDEAVAATCTTEGKTEGCHCSVCGKVLVVQETIPALEHKLTYTFGDNTITQKCSREGCNHTATATFTASGAVYTGAAVEGVAASYNGEWAGSAPAISYSNNVNAGEATATITAGGQTVSVNFTIAKAANHTLTLGNLSQTSGSVSAVTCTVSPADATAAITVEYQVNGQWTSQVPTAAGSYPVRARVSSSSNLELGAADAYTTGTLTIAQQSSGGSSSSGSSSGSGNKTETERNPDGSTTTTVTRPNGTVTKTTRNPDGSQEVVETKRDGTVTTTTTDADGNKTEVVENPDGSSETTIRNKDGSFSTTTVSEDGMVETSVKLPAGVVNDAGGEAITLPMPEISAPANRDESAVITLDLPANTSTKVEIPVERVTSGTVAVLVQADGSEEIIKTSLATDSGVAVTLSDGDTVKVVDNSKSFTDVPASYWGAEAVDFASSRELFSGTGETTFSPDTTMDRGMLVTVLYRLENEPSVGGNSSYADVPEGVYYAGAVAWADANSIVTGYEDATFAPGRAITREEMAVVFYRYAQRKGYDTTQGGMAIREYADYESISGYALDAMAWANANGLITGDAGMLNPHGLATRAQVATILMRFIQNIAQ